MEEKPSKARYQLPGRDNPRVSSFVNPMRYEEPLRPSVDTPMDDGVLIDTLPEPEVLGVDDVVPVRVVEFAREPDRFRDARAYKLDIAPGGVVGLARKRERTRLLLRVDSVVNTDVVYVATEADGNTERGFPIRGGDQPLELTAQRGWHLILSASAAAALEVSVIEEFVTEIR